MISTPLRREKPVRRPIVPPMRPNWASVVTWMHGSKSQNRSFFHLDIPFNLIVGCGVKENVDSVQWSATLPSPSLRTCPTCALYMCYVSIPIPPLVVSEPTCPQNCVHHLPDNQLHPHHRCQIRTCPTCPLAAGGWSKSTWKPKCGVPPPTMQICSIDFFCFYPHYRTIL